ncbi:MAG: IclR family transcriptional regulator [Actinomycetota bacterium]
MAAGPTEAGLMPAGVQSVERAFDLLRALAVAPAGLTDLAARSDLPKSTVARLLGTLEVMGAVARDEDGRTYRIGMGLVELAGAIDASAELATAIRPHLIALADRTGEAAGFSVPNGYTMHYLVHVESPNPVQVRDYTGLTVPIHVGPSGLCIMAHWPTEELGHYLRRSLERFTDNTMTDPDLLRARLADVRSTGFCWIYEEFAEGINSVAAPIFDVFGHTMGAIHVHGPSYRFPARQHAADIARVVVESARRFTARSDPRREET